MRQAATFTSIVKLHRSKIKKLLLVERKLAQVYKVITIIITHILYHLEII